MYFEGRLADFRSLCCEVSWQQKKAFSYPLATYPLALVYNSRAIMQTMHKTIYLEII